MERGYRKVGCACLCLMLLAGLVGCGKSDSPAVGAAASGESTAQKSGPDAAVREFLESVRVGDDAKAAGMLTDVARAETAKAQLVVAPPGSDTAKFEVGGVEFVEGGAHVESRWTDLDETGQPHSDEIVWFLREQPEGWRIAGMATRLFPEEPPLFLNFEDPEEVIRKTQLAEEEMLRRMSEAAAQATGAADGAVDASIEAARQAQVLDGAEAPQRQ